MSERIIAKSVSRHRINGEPPYQESWSELHPDPEAPSVSEIVAVLKAAGGKLSVEYHGQDAGLIDNIDNLIARLEGA